MTAPIALTIHPGGGPPPTWRRSLIAEWLTANGISPNHVAADDPITVLTVPFRPPDADSEDPWLIQVIVFRQYYVNAEGTYEQDLISRKTVTFQRTVPLTIPFPANPTTAAEGTRHGQADRQAAEQAPEVEVRDAREEGVSDRHEGQGPQRAGQGQPARDEVAAEEGPRCGDEEVPEPEEDRRQPQEEVGTP